MGFRYSQALFILVSIESPSERRMKTDGIFLGFGKSRFELGEFNCTVTVF